VEGAMIAVLLYTLPVWVFLAVGYVLLVIGVVSFVYCAAEVSHAIDEHEARIIKDGKLRW
jgi:hypothetical protein